MNNSFIFLIHNLKSTNFEFFKTIFLPLIIKFTIVNYFTKKSKIKNFIQKLFRLIHSIKIFL